MKKTIVFRSAMLGSAVTAALNLNPAFAGDDTIPYEFAVSPNSEFSADEIYIAVVGYQNGGYAFMDFDNDFEINQMDSTDNTLASPNDDGYSYIDMFVPLSEIEEQTIPMPQLSSVRMYIAFGSTLYIRYDSESDTGGYVAPTLNNEGDANYGIRFEMVELTYNDYGLWTNTTRVDSYQYPMGIEVWGGDGFYKRVGEILTHDDIVNAWQAMTQAETQFTNLYLVDDEYDYDIIVNPSHHEDFSSSGGQYEDYFDAYVDAVWSRYSTENLCLSIGEAGKWVGRVNSSDQFVFTEYTDDYTDENSGCSDVTLSTDAMISAKPGTYEIMSASGVLAEDVSETSDTDNDKNIQKHFSAAFNRGAIDLDADEDAWISWDDSSTYFDNAYYGHNQYVEFWHSEDISFEGETYAFAYDDVFDYSSTIHTTSPEQVLVTIGGFSADDYVEAASIELSCETLSLTTGDVSTISADVLPVSASNQSVSWATSDDDVVTVDDGELTAVSEGTATVTASSYTASVSAVCYVTVTDPIPENFIARIEAEDYDEMSGVETETTSDTDGGENVGYIDTGDWMRYSINIPSAGTYQFDFRLASAYSTGSFELRNANDDVLATVEVNNTGSFQTWETQSLMVDVEEGDQTLTIVATADGWNINWFEVYSTDTDDQEENATNTASSSAASNSSAGSLSWWMLAFMPLLVGCRKR
ncbi:beta-1,3-glucanase family protein [Reinekea marinisedimentorum]|uniref:Putative secreted protein n=1 Tax=Reinekea marinisedimentorum TaxID=230495 RepID=A0A4R3HQZ6_9GAMM|nr:beta-1,3-glucanase family protein [Reinekea marinisedimentorum]TCS35194.1 putative secreted protein [Reinekea marinisedimentorum]